MSLVPLWPPEVPPHILRRLASRAASYALARGLQYLPPNITEPSSSTPASAVHAPITLFPTPFPRSLFEKARKLQRIYNVLYARIALDEEFLEDILAGVDPDDFVRKLWDQWKRMTGRDIVQSYSLGIFRSDYLLHEGDGGQPLALKQVEFNTVAVSLASLSDRTAAMHRYLHGTGCYSNFLPNITAKDFPVNDSIAGVAEGLAAAHKKYNIPGTKILFVVLQDERNVFDQRLLEYELYEKYSIDVVRQTFDQLERGIRLDNVTRGLYLIQDDEETFADGTQISVVYFRAGYGPESYVNPANYHTRFLIERSLAIKCPSIPLQLAGSKKVQQALFTRHGLLESLLCDKERWGKDNTFRKEEVDELRETWIEMWGLDEEEPPDGTGVSPVAGKPLEKYGVRKAREQAHSIVLKPFREGGGNNIFKEDIPAALDAMPEKTRGEWIAQRLIMPPKGLSNWFLRPDEESREAVKTEVVCEFGVFGWNLFHPVEGMTEKEVGWLVRTKNRDANEGGVAVGISVLDSVVLVDD